MPIEEYLGERAQHDEDENEIDPKLVLCSLHPSTNSYPLGGC